jgi:hypothetical protein
MIVLLVLVVLWAAVLLPPILRSRTAGGHHGVSDFMDGLRSLGHRAGHLHRGPSFGPPVLHGPVSGRPAVSRSREPLAPPMAYRPMPGGISPMQQRRRNVLLVLGAAVAFTILFALFVRTPLAYLLLLVSMAALGGYCYLLVHFKHRGTVLRAAPAPRVYVTPGDDSEDEAPAVGDNVIVLRRSVG